MYTKWIEGHTYRAWLPEQRKSKCTASRWNLNKTWIPYQESWSSSCSISISWKAKSANSVQGEFEVTYRKTQATSYYITYIFTNVLFLFWAAMISFIWSMLCWSTFETALFRPLKPTSRIPICAANTDYHIKQFNNYCTCPIFHRLTAKTEPPTADSEIWEKGVSAPHLSSMLRTGAILAGSWSGWSRELPFPACSVSCKPIKTYKLVLFTKDLVAFLPCLWYTVHLWGKHMWLYLLHYQVSCNLSLFKVSISWSSITRFSVICSFQGFFGGLRNVHSPVSRNYMPLRSTMTYTLPRNSTRFHMISQSHIIRPNIKLPLVQAQYSRQHSATVYSYPHIHIYTSCSPHLTIKAMIVITRVNIYIR